MAVRSILIKTWVAVCTSVFAMGSQAALVTLMGTNYIYEYDDAQLDPGGAAELYGAPIIVGDTVVFTPGAFRAQSTDGVALNTAGARDIVSATFIFSSVRAKDGSALDSLYVGESGDYRIDGGGEVEVDLFLQGVTNAGGGILGSGDVSGNWSISGDSGGQQNWGVVDAVLDLTALESPPFLGGEPAGPQTDVAVTIQNTLYAETGVGSGHEAWIQKKLVFSAVVPLPAAAWLFGSALVGLVAVGRRKRIA